jgi:hypothetical protein
MKPSRTTCRIAWRYWRLRTDRATERRLQPLRHRGRIGSGSMYGTGVSERHAVEAFMLYDESVEGAAA